MHGISRRINGAVGNKSIKIDYELYHCSVLLLWKSSSEMGESMKLFTENIDSGWNFDLIASGHCKLHVYNKRQSVDIDAIDLYASFQIQ